MATPATATTTRLMTVFHVSGCACSALMAAAFAATGADFLTSAGPLPGRSGCLRAVTLSFKFQESPARYPVR